MRSEQPFFAQSTRTETLVMRICVAANLGVVVGCAAYLVVHVGLAPSWPYLVATVLAGWFLADFGSGLVHWGLDTWFDERAFGRAVAIAREHHTHPQNILGYGFLEHATLGSAPSAVVVGPLAGLTALAPASVATYCLMIVWLMVSGCLFLGTSFHNLAHKRSSSRLIRLAQRVHLLTPPDHHWVHHRTQTVHYCVINGWANYVCDGLDFWRRAERLIERVSGAEARRDDLAWQQRFRETGTLASPTKDPDPRGASAGAGP